MVDIFLEIWNGSRGKVAITVPMLVSPSYVDYFLLGLNVMEELIKESAEKVNSVSLCKLLSEAMDMHE